MRLCEVIGFDLADVILEGGKAEPPHLTLDERRAVELVAARDWRGLASWAFDQQARGRAASIDDDPAAADPRFPYRRSDRKTKGGSPMLNDHPEPKKGGRKG